MERRDRAAGHPKWPAVILLVLVSTLLLGLAILSTFGGL